MMAPMKKLISSEISVFREAVDIFGKENIIDACCAIACKFIDNTRNLRIDTEEILMHSLKTFFANSKFSLNNEYKHLERIIQNVIFSRQFKDKFSSAVKECMSLFKLYSKKIESGARLRFTNESLKLANIDRRFRKYIKYVYIVKNDYLDRNGAAIKKSLANAKILIVDEDVDSGMTLKLCIDAIDEILPNKNNGQLKCLVNGLSAKVV